MITSRSRRASNRVRAANPKPDTVAAVIEQWLKRHVHKNKLRTCRRVGAGPASKVYRAPYRGERVFVDIKRNDIAKLLDMIEDDNGPAMASAILVDIALDRDLGAKPRRRLRATLRQEHAPHTEENRRRKRILNDAELRRGLERRR